MFDIPKKNCENYINIKKELIVSSIGKRKIEKPENKRENKHYIGLDICYYFFNVKRIKILYKQLINLCVR